MAKERLAANKKIKTNLNLSKLKYLKKIKIKIGYTT